MVIAKGVDKKGMLKSGSFCCLRDTYCKRDLSLSTKPVRGRGKIVRLVREIIKRDWSLDRNWREGLYGEINSRRYAG